MASGGERREEKQPYQMEKEMTPIELEDMKVYKKTKTKKG